MTAVAAHAMLGRLRRPLPNGGTIAAVALTISTAGTLAWVVFVVVRVHPWYAPQYVVPIAGMILGNAMTGAALAGALERDLEILQGRGSRLDARYLGEGRAEVGGRVVLDEVREFAL